MKKAVSGCSAVMLSVLSLMTGCEKKNDSSSVSYEKSGADKGLSIIDGIKIGMTTDEVFAVAGKEYDSMNKDDTYHNTVEYDYCCTDKTFGTGLEGYMCFEFSLDTNKLVTYGYHFGQKGDFENHTFPYTEDELKNAYASIKEQVTAAYGEGTSSDEKAVMGVLEENTWRNDEGEIWAVYGTDLWAYEPTEVYENGTNEVVITCSVEADAQETSSEE